MLESVGLVDISLLIAEGVYSCGHWRTFELLGYSIVNHIVHWSIDLDLLSTM